MGMRKFLAAGAVAAAVAGFGLVSAPAFAQEQDTMVQIPLTEVYQTGDAGSTVALGQTAVDGNLVGRSCSVTATISNNDSLHPGNTLVVTSGGASVQISGIEDAVGSSTLSGGTIVLGDSISASVVLGADGATSIGSRLSVACTALPDTEPPVATPGNPSYTG